MNKLIAALALTALTVTPALATEMEGAGSAGEGVQNIRTLNEASQPNAYNCPGSVNYDAAKDKVC